MTSYRKYLRQPWIWCMVATMGLNISAWLVAIYLFPKDRSAAILHYNTSVGIDFIGEGSQIQVIPLIGTALLVANVLLALLLRRVSKPAAGMFWGSLPLIQAILVGALLLILRLNT
ncbi:MAG: hypothetical protein HYZ63_03570 [Candidatus Andersenbacteria bacterium]|nr:hypothetical protein [Candidatus Andersenbacteria bacterium]